MAQTIETIKTHATTIKNETRDGANTALRVGGTILELVEYVETLGTGGGSGSGMTDQERAQLNKASSFITRLAQNGWVSLRNYFEQKDGKLVYHPYRFIINADGSIAAQAMEGTALPTATQAQDGLLSAADKKRLDSLVAGTTYDPRVTNMIAGLYDDVYGTGEYIRTPVTNIIAMPSADMLNYKIIYNQARIMEDGTVETSLVETSIGAADGISAGVVSAADYNKFWDASEHLKNLLAGLNWDLYGTGQTILRPVVDMTYYLSSDGIGVRYNRLEIAADGTCQLEAYKDVVLPNCDGITSGALSVEDWQKIQSSDTKINNLISGLYEDVYGTGAYVRMPVTWLTANPQIDGESWKIQFNRAKIAADGTIETTLEDTTINSADNIQAGLMSVADWTYLNALRNYVSSDGNITCNTIRSAAGNYDNGYALEAGGGVYDLGRLYSEQQGGWCGGDVYDYWGKILEFNHGDGGTVDMTATVLFTTYNTRSEAIFAIMVIDVRGGNWNDITNISAKWVYSTSRINEEQVKVTYVSKNNNFYIRIYTKANTWGNSTNCRVLFSHEWAGKLNNFVTRTWHAVYLNNGVEAYKTLPSDETEVAISMKNNDYFLQKTGGTIQKWLKILGSGVTADDGAGCRIDHNAFYFMPDTSDRSRYTIFMHYESGTIECATLIQNSDMREKNVIEDKELTLEEIADAPLFSYTSTRLPESRLSVGTSAQYWDAARPSEFTALDQRGYFTMDYGKLATAMGISLARHLRDYEQRTDKRLEALEQRLQTLEA